MSRPHITRFTLPKPPRRPRFSRFLLPAAPIILVALAARVCTAQFLMDDPGANITEYAGDANNLPVNCRSTPDELVRLARGIPAVQSAMDEFARRGYVAVPGADTAITGCSQPVSAVTLVYQKPGAWIDSNHVAVPSILVTTQLNTQTGEPLTTVTAGIMVADGEAEVAFSGDSLAMFRSSDHSFDVAASGGGGGRGVIQEGLNDPDSKFNKFMRCAGWGTVGCFMGGMRLGGLGSLRIKITLLFAEPELALALLEGCALVSSVVCLGRL